MQVAHNPWASYWPIPDSLPINNQRIGLYHPNSRVSTLRALSEYLKSQYRTTCPSWLKKVPLFSRVSPSMTFSWAATLVGVSRGGLSIPRLSDALEPMSVSTHPGHCEVTVMPSFFSSTASATLTASTTQQPSTVEKCIEEELHARSHATAAVHFVLSPKLHQRGSPVLVAKITAKVAQGITEESQGISGT